MKNKKTILIVEDKLIPAEYLSCTLKDNGYKVLEIADTGRKAIDIAKRDKPDAVLMDIMLKDNISGTEAAIQICKNTPHCKIIFITAYSDKEMMNSAYASRAYAYLLKLGCRNLPISPLKNFPTFQTKEKNNKLK